MKTDTSKLKSVNERTGKLPYTLKNDYLFKVVFQCEDGDYEILTSLLSALLGVSEESITSIEVTNSIIPGDSIDDKTVMLDIALTLNNCKRIDLEMQVQHQTFWKNRSCYYLARMYSEGLLSGKSYEDLKPAHHIGIVDFDIDGLTPRLFANYRMADTETGEIYSDNLQISVLNLTRTDTATRRDKELKLDKWAAVFRATTWEELKAVSKDLAVVDKISERVYVMTADEMIQSQCWKREMQENTDRAREQKLKAMEQEVENLRLQNQQAEKRILELEAQLKTATQ